MVWWILTRFRATEKKISRCWELHSGTNPTLIDYDVIFFVCYIPQIFYIFIPARGGLQVIGCNIRIVIIKNWGKAEPASPPSDRNFFLYFTSFLPLSYSI